MISSGMAKAEDVILVADSNKCDKALETLKSLLLDYKTYTPFCHGTKLRNAKQVLEDGELRPRECIGEEGIKICRPSNYGYDPKLDSDKDLVYLGKNNISLCWASAYNNWDEREQTWTREGTPGGIFYIDEIPNPENLVHDEDHFTRGYWDHLEYGIKRLKEMLRFPEERYKDADESFKRNWLEFREEQMRGDDGTLSLTTNTPSFPQKVENEVIEVLKSCPTRKIKNLILDLPIWIQSLLDISTAAYKGRIPINPDKSIRSGCQPGESWGPLSKNLDDSYRCL